MSPMRFCPTGLHRLRSERCQGAGFRQKRYSHARAGAADGDLASKILGDLPRSRSAGAHRYSQGSTIAMAEVASQRPYPFWTLEMCRSCHQKLGETFGCWKWR